MVSWWLGSAWAVEVAGRVTEDPGGSPVAGADVSVEGGPSTRTDPDGGFTLDLPVGPARVQVSSVDHWPVTVEVEVVDAMAPLVIPVRRGDFEEVVVLYYKDPDPVVTQRSVSAEEVARVPGGFGDPVRVVTSLPGAARPSFGRGQLVIRGGNPDDTTVFVDGVEIPDLYHVGGYRSVVHPSLISKVDLLPGVFPSRFGDATSGVVDLQTRAFDTDDPWEWSARIDLLDASLAGRGTIGDAVGVAAAVRRSYIDGILAPLGSTFVLPRWFDYAVQLETLALGDHTVRLMAFGVQDQLGGDASDFGITSRSSTHRGVASWVYAPSATFRTLAQASIGWDDQEGGIGTDLALREVGPRGGGRVEARWQATDAVLAVAGGQVDASDLTIEARLPFDPIEGGDGPYEASETRTVTRVDPYAEVQLRPLAERGRLVLTGGIRADSMFREGLPAVWGASPRGTARLAAIEGGTVKLGASRTHQLPSARTLAFSPDEPLALEGATTAEIGWEQRFGVAASADLVLYGRWMDDLAVRQFGFTSFDNEGVGRALGMEVLLRKEPVGPTFGWISYALSKAERKDAPDGEWYPYDFDQTHNLVAVGGWKLGRGWDVSGRFQYTTGNPYTPYEGAVFELSDGSYQGIAGPKNSARLPAFVAFDLRIAKEFRWDTGSFTASLDVLNLVHGENPEIALDAYDYSEQTYVSGLPTLPAPGLQVDVRF